MRAACKTAVSSLDGASSEGDTANGGRFNLKKKSKIALLIFTVDIL